MTNILYLILKLLSFIPLRIIHAIAKGIGLLLYYGASKSSHTARTNIQRCFPKWSKQQQEDCIKAAMVHTVMRAAEMPWIWFNDADTVLSRVTAIEGEQYLPTPPANTIILLPHTGSWEVVSKFFASRYPTKSLYKPLKNNNMNQLLLRLRSNTDTGMLPTSTQGVKALFKALRQGYSTGIFVDHQPGDHGGVFVPFMGIPAQTMTLAPKIIQKTGITTIFACAERLPAGRFKLHFKPASPNLNDTNLEQAACAMNQDIESMIRLFPEQHEWTYKRFRRRPPGANEPRFYQQC